MASHIWLSRRRRRWIEVADENGKLDISSLALALGLRREILFLGSLALRKRTTINIIRIVLGPKAGMIEELAVVVDGTTLPPVEPPLPTCQFLVQGCVLVWGLHCSCAYGNLSRISPLLLVHDCNYGLA